MTIFVLYDYSYPDPSFSPGIDVGDIIDTLGDRLELWPLIKLLQVAEGNGLNVPVPLVIEEVKESVGVGLS